MTQVTPGEYSYVDGYGNVNAYSDETSAAQSGDAHVLIPSDNLDAGLWSTMQTGGQAGIVLSSAPAAGAIVPIHSSMLQGGDIQHMNQYYGTAYTAETGQMPGAYPGLIPVWIIIMIAVAIIATLMAIAAIVILCHLIDASTGSTVKTWTDPATGDTWSQNCTSSLFGGSNCTECDLTKNTCPAGSTTGTGGLTDTITQVAEVGIVVGVAAVALYLIYDQVKNRKKV